MNAPAPHHEITLDDKYALQSGRAFMTGTQALVRLPMLQRVRDLAAGLNTAGFISGYRGSPLGGFDQALWKAKKFLDEHHVKFQPGVNEDLAATSIWGTQQVNLYPDAKYDGVFAMWYGKGPGVDRCGDVFKHANSAGTSKHGGVLVLAGDDHAAKSSTLAHQSEHIFKACCIPVLNPASVQEYLDLGLHGIAERVAADAGIRLYKGAMSWPLEPQGARRFAEGLEEILVVEEKRQVIEYQIKEELYNWREGMRAPRVVGKFDDNGEWSIAEGKPAGNWLLPAHYELSAALIAKALASRFAKFGLDRAMGERYRERLAYPEFKEKALAKPRVVESRLPYFCSGCPHNTSTKVPEGSRAMAGIGCHFMAVWMDRNTSTFTHMGAEGAPWIGQAPFTECPHVFANLGDGTYYHSGLLAIRAAVAAGVSMTYKILYNDAVAMTGGQPFDGPLDPGMISRQIAAEGVSPIVAVVDEKEPLPAGLAWAPGTTIRPREDLDAVQRELREKRGVSAIIDVQTCATEKRRRRKRKELPDPARRVVINEMVCEGCGDCSVQSNCLSVEPLETEFGRKRTINQSSCNKDYSCLKGFCPSFVTVEGGTLKKGKAALPEGEAEFAVPAPWSALDRPFGILVTGIGGMGVITIGQIVAMAAHLEGKCATVLDMSGLAQKFGPVMSHVRIAPSPAELHSVRVGTGAADLVLGCDLVVTSGSEALSKMNDKRTKVLVNATVSPTADFVKNPDWQLPGTDLQADIVDAAGAKNVDFVPAGKLATALMGDAIATNMFMLGYAFQKGRVPLAEGSLVRAIELNGVAVEFNRKAFLWGRRAAADLARVERIATPAEVIPISQAFSRNLDELIARRVEFLTGYQNRAYAERYRKLVERVRSVETHKAGGGEGKFPLTEAVARYYFKLMAYKDEYEVARLHSDPGFMQKIEGMFEGGYKLKFHLAPPIFNRPDPCTDEARKSQFGPWMMMAFRILAKLKRLRGTPLDIFGMTQERKTERRLIEEYEATVAELLERLDGENQKLAAEVASVPEHIRGFGHVKRRHLDEAKKKEAGLLAAFRASRPSARAA